MNKRRRRLLMASLLIITLIFIGCILTGNHFYNLAISSNSDKTSVLSAKHNRINYGDEGGGFQPLTHGAEWLQEHGYEEQFMQSYDGLQLRAMMVLNGDSTKWVIICHGYNDQAETMVNAGSSFYNMGYNVLMPDARGHGQSEGDYIGMGWHDRLDTIDWANRLIHDYGDEIDIALFGISMGGANVMMASGEPLPENIKVIIEDCGYSSVEDEFRYQLNKLYNLPYFPVLNCADMVTRSRAGFNFEEATAVKQVAKSKTPTLFIHGSEDTFVPPYMLDELYNAASCEKEKMLVEGAGHGLSARVAGDQYWDTVEQFLNKYINR